MSLHTHFFKTAKALVFGCSFLAISFVSVGGFFPATAHAERESQPWYTSIGAGWLFTEADEPLQGGQLYEVKTGYNFNDRWALEGNVGILPLLKERDFEPNDNRFQVDEDALGIKLGADALYHLRENKKFDPFLAVGGGTIIYDESQENGKADAYYGGGAGLFVHYSEHFFSRADYRLVAAGQRAQLNHHVLFSLGYAWGGKRSNEGEGEGDNTFYDKKEPELKTIYYDFDSSELDSEAQGTLQSNAKWLEKNEATEIVVEGHCDERGTNEYNMALGERRARSAQEYLRSLGVAKERMTPISYGEEQPAALGHDEEAWAQNRRAEFKPTE